MPIEGSQELDLRLISLRNLLSILEVGNDHPTPLRCFLFVIDLPFYKLLDL